MKKPVAARRAEILDTTCAVVRERGFGATRVQDVAGRLGVSTGLIHYHFENKDHLLAEAFAHAARLDIERFPEALDQPTPVAALAHAIALYAPEGGDSSWPMWIDAWGEAQRNARLRAISQELDLAWMGLLKQVVERGVASGDFVCPDPHATAWRLAAVLDGLAIEAVVHAQNVARNELVSWVAHLAAAELGIDAGVLLELVGAARGAD